MPSRLLGPGYAEEHPVVINHYNNHEVKLALDHALQQIATLDYDFKQSFVHTDVKLASGYGCVLCSLVAFGYNYIYPFEQSKPVIWACVALYFVFNAIFTLYGYLVEKNAIFVGHKKLADGKTEAKLTINTIQKKYSSEFTIEVIYSVQGKSKSAKIHKSIGGWFDVAGQLSGKHFHADVESLFVSILGKSE
ncbi:signal peptidase complex subunit 2 [Polychytrium aggregatum]|uniref:signal peptidase complex subunit 2 n=1 Tax=Polychytrium aggregatum TaxID=110093 RepID=UPI0022FE6CA1|nr:signal peptidase complex subunit 2 [Polychytrium aggregatum]KAI9199829.1 signal peptidase complex subunit 2 [Polychytrium aggregatum]